MRGQIAQGEARPPRRPRRLGNPRGARSQCHRHRRHAQHGRAGARLPLDRAADLRSRRRTARGADGQLGGGAHQPGRRPDRLPGPGAHQPLHRGRLLLPDPRPAGGGAQGQGGRGRGPLHGARLRRWRAQPGGAPARAPRAGAARGGGQGLRARLPRRPRHPAEERARLRAGPRGPHEGEGPRQGGHGHGAVLRHGPRQALGPGEGGLRRHGPLGGVSRHLRRERGGAGLRPRRDRRVREAQRGGERRRRARGPHQGRRRARLLQLPRRPGARDHPRLHAGRLQGLRRLGPPPPLRLRRDGPVRRDLRPARRLPSRAAHRDLPGDRLAGRLEAAPLRRDREVRPRHLLLQRRTGDRLPGRGPRARAQPARREDLRREAGDERARGHRQGGRGHPLAPLRVHPGELRQPRHGRAHRKARRRGARR